jgi:hypothetical protein
MLCFNAKHLCSFVFIVWDANGINLLTKKAL